MTDLNILLEWVGIALATLMVLLLAVAVPLSLRRNRKSIDLFDKTELDELHICLPDYRLKGVTKKLSQMGWDVVEAEQNAQSAGYSQVLLKRRDEANA
ncbi:MAG: hypothetical protein KKH37_02005, partial [Alphaproteobacteria bacterium]|nr:hypothetical protein [Alphaproteobacteria bacterium]